MIELEYLYRIGLSLLIGLFIGYEREKLNKNAGLRTCAIVCLASTLFTIIALSFQDMTNADPLRLLYGPIIGISFIGSGVIIQKKNNVEGITTAAVLFFLVAGGLLTGIGEYFMALLSAFVVYIILKLKYWKITIRRER